MDGLKHNPTPPGVDVFLCGVILRDKSVFSDKVFSIQEKNAGYPNIFHKRVAGDARDFQLKS
jgi:hypothetical protein